MDRTSAPALQMRTHHAEHLPASTIDAYAQHTQADHLRRAWIERGRFAVNHCNMNRAVRPRDPVLVKRHFHLLYFGAVNVAIDATEDLDPRERQLICIALLRF